jgi:hypothetical protein
MEKGSGFENEKVKVMIMIMNFFGHDHDHYEKNDVTKICQYIYLERIFSPAEK